MLTKVLRAESVLLSGFLKNSAQEAKWLGRFVTTQTKNCTHSTTCPNYRKETICCLYAHHHENSSQVNGTISRGGNDVEDSKMSPWNPMHRFVHPLHQFTHPFHPANVFYSAVDSSGEISYSTSKEISDPAKSSNHDLSNTPLVSNKDSSSASESYTQDSDSSSFGSSSSSYDDFSSSSSSFDSSSGDSGGGGSSYD